MGMIYIGVVLAIASECRDGRTPCAHRRTPDEGPPTKKQSTGLFAFISGVRPKLMLLPILRFACAGDFALCGARLGAPPRDPASLSRKAGAKAFISLADSES